MSSERTPGGAVGQSQVDVDSLDTRAHDTARKVRLGVRRFGRFSAEAEYADLGRPRTSTAAARVERRARSIAERVEFEQFRASGDSLNSGSVGALWSFFHCR